MLMYDLDGVRDLDLTPSGCAVADLHGTISRTGVGDLLNELARQFGVVVVLDVTSLTLMRVNDVHRRVDAVT